MLKRLPRPIRIATIAIFLLAVAARLVPGARTIDDSYITFRYARNILAGNGFVYNPGEHVLGTTTPLYTILLVSLGALTGGSQAPFPQIALVVNALADAITCLVLFQLGQRLGSTRAGLAAAMVWALAPFSVTFAVGGLETSLYVLMLTGTVSAHLKRRRSTAAILAALALLTRPDALILLGPLAVDRLYQAWQPRLPARFRRAGEPAAPITAKEVLTFGVPVVVWLTFATIYFGTPIPHSIAAKSVAYLLPQNSALVRLLQHYATPFLGYLTFGIIWIRVGIILFPFLFVIGARFAIGKTPSTWPWLAYPWLYFATFAIADPLIFRWYLTPPLPAYILGILIGIDQLLSSLEGKFAAIKVVALPHPRVTASGLLQAFFVVLAPISLTLHGWTLHPDHGLTRPAPDMAWYKVELLYRQAADVVNTEISKSANTRPVVAAGDVGVLGYYTSATILDTVGLNSPISSRYYPLDPRFYVINYAVPPDLILNQMPDYIVLLESYGREGLLKDPRFWQRYHLVRKIPTDLYSSDGMLVLARNPSS